MGNIGLRNQRYPFQRPEKLTLKGKTGFVFPLSKSEFQKLVKDKKYYFNQYEKYYQNYTEGTKKIIHKRIQEYFKTFTKIFNIEQSGFKNCISKGN